MMAVLFFGIRSNSAASTQTEAQETARQQAALVALETPPPVKPTAIPATTIQNTTQLKAQSTAAASPTGSSSRAARIGVFVADSPSDPATASWLNQEKSLGINTVFNYTAADGTVDQVNAYLAHAQSLGIQVIISLKDFYDQEGEDFVSDYSQYGSTNEQIALGIVRQFAANPAVWGFDISDEQPEDSSGLDVWQPILATRYQQIKAITAKPVMEVLVGATSPDAAARQSFLRALRGTTDHFALDYYPIPFQSITPIQDYAADMVAAGDSNGWFVNQAFSWNANTDYAATASALGFNPSAARLPTSLEMTSMADLALNGGARNILFYHFEDIRNNAAQMFALRSAIAAIR